MNKPKYRVGQSVYDPNLKASFEVLEIHVWPSPTQGTRFIYTVGYNVPEPMLTTVEEEFGDIDDE